MRRFLEIGKDERERARQLPRLPVPGIQAREIATAAASPRVGRGAESEAERNRRVGETSDADADG